MEEKLIKIVWYHDSHFIKEKDLGLASPEKLSPKPIGEPFQLTNHSNIKDRGSNLGEKIDNTLNEFVAKKFPNANAYSESVISMNGFYDGVYQLYKI
jgi:hypothetical protein